ncbi:glycoside hydrolase family 3 N-terminal domain-containing protein [Rubrivirga sp.]|uniref:glycoside hydrolase family 3 N-terminal domain-containing protein n=1 Tax=Rubrivirga sp. TaxID=1885344 RepID=UPI003B51C3E4
MLVRLALLLALAAGAHAQEPLYRDASAPIERRVADLVGRMTLAEKIGQLTQYTAHGTDEALYEGQMREGSAGSYLNVAFSWITVDTSGVYQLDPNGTLAEGARRTNRLQRIAVEESRLGIPALFAHDVIHGLRTIFPVPLGMASSWNPAATERAARIAAVEASSIGIRWVFAPMVDVSPDPRWGRIVEGAGEDTYLNSVMAAAAVRGFQTDDLTDPTATLATPKHYVAYGAALGGRDYNTVDVSMQTLREVYLPPFQAALAEGAGSVMVAFNEIAGVPATSNPTTVRDILRGEYGFDGIVVSDWGSIWETQPHGYVADNCEAGARALQAGVDVDMQSNAYRDCLADLVASRRVSLADVDRAVANVLRAKFRLGLFETPYTDESRADRELLSDEHAAAAREIAGQSIVLLKNEPVGGAPVLPLATDVGRIAVIGSLADDPKAQLGSWSAAGATGDAITVLDAIRQQATGEVVYARGAAPDTSDASGIEEAVQLAAGADIAVLVVGETADMSGEAHSRASLDLPGAQPELVRAVHATGTPVVVVLMNGRPLSTTWEAEHVPAIVEAWFGGTMAGPAVADVLFGARNPSGKLPVTVPRTVGQVPLTYNPKNTGRPWLEGYVDIENGPLYPFGWGLSYTTFAYSDLAVADTTVAVGGDVEVSVTLANTGGRGGTETVQLYLRDEVANVTRPVMELKAFRQVVLAPGERRTVSFALGPDDLGYLDAAGVRQVEPGRHRVFVGGSSAETLEAAFHLVP